MKIYTFTLLLSSIICLTFSSFAFAQNSKNTRERLNERLQVLIELQKSKDYERLYDLLTKKETDSKESFVKSSKTFDSLGRAELLKFVPKEVYLIEPSNDWGLIKGCGEFVEKGKKKLLESQVEVVYENDDWYFSSLITISSAFGIKPKKCSLNQ